MEKLYHIGRDKTENEIFIVDESVSLSHAQIFIDENVDLTIIDLSSKNGVFVNNVKIESPLKLNDQDLIRLGNVSFKKKDLLNAIRKYESNKIKKNISFISTIKKKSLPKINLINKNYSKSIYIFLTILLILIITVLGYFIIDQNSIKGRLVNENLEKIMDTAEKIIEKKEKVNEDEDIIPVKEKSSITYDFSCLSNEEDEGTGKLILELGEITSEVQNTLLNDVKISIDDEIKEGDNYINFLKKDKKFIKSGNELSKLNEIMDKLTSKLSSPRGFDYKIFLVDENIKNVYTIGGNIIFYKEMYDFCQSDSEIAALISHEIAHNELGHSILALKKEKLSDEFGIFGEIALIFEQTASTVFNQRQEAEADMFGQDLIIPLNYDNCAPINLLERISANEGEFDLVDNLFRSHPYSKNRISCLKRHLEKNYQNECN
jgi:pSer/pThr/pTyr-binding forkhead associated (FHA) protein